MRTFIVLAAAMSLSACASTPEKPIAVTASDYCQIAEKLSWSPRDTTRTIQGIRRENAKWDRRCLKGKPTS